MKRILASAYRWRALVALIAAAAAVFTEPAVAKFKLDTESTAKGFQEEILQFWNNWGLPIQFVLLLATLGAYLLWRDTSSVWKYFAGALIIVVFGDEFMKFVSGLDAS